MLGVVLAIAGLVSLNEAWNVWNGWDGTGVLPLFVGSFLVGLAVVFVLFPSHDRRGEVFAKREALHVAVVSGAFGLYMALMPTIGYALSTWLFLGGVTHYISRRHLLVTLAWTGGVAFATYFVFKKLLGMYLPVGFVGL